MTDEARDVATAGAVEVMARHLCACSGTDPDAISEVAGEPSWQRWHGREAEALLLALTAAGYHLHRWEDISEAPKDDGRDTGTGPTLLLAYPARSENGAERVCTGHWLDNSRFSPPWQGFRPIPRGSVPFGKPTHFAPLPPAPPEPAP